MIKNKLSEKLGTRKWYNPNSYTALDAAICFLAIIILFEIASKVFVAIFRPLYQNGIISDYYLISILSTFFTQGVIIGLALVFAKTRKVSLFSGGGYRYRIDIVDILFGVVLTLGILFVFNSTHSYFVDDIYYTFYGVNYAEYTALTTPYIPDGNAIFGLFYLFILIPVLPAICEEVLFRGVIMRGFTSYGATAGVLLSAVMFSFMHGSFEQMILQFIGGIAIGAVTVITKNFLVGAIMHLANNFFAVVISFADYNFSLNGYSAFLFDAILIASGLVFIIIGVLYFYKKIIAANNQKLLGQKPTVIGMPIYACIAKEKSCESDFKAVESGEINLQKLRKNKNNLFLYKGKFFNFNKYSLKILEYSLIVAGICLAVYLIFSIM